MKKFIILAGILLLAACTKDQGATSPVKDEQFVTLNFTTFTFSPMTKAGTDLVSLITRLDIFVINGADTIVVNQAKTETDGFGSVSLSLNKTKTYTLYAIAHKGNGPATLDGSELSFADNKITDTFFYSCTFCPATTSNINCTMSRIVGMFKLTIQDALPEGLAKMRFSFSDAPLGYNVGGFPINQGERLSIINNPTSAQDGSTTFKLYCLADSEASAIDVTVSALDADDQVIEERIFENIPIKAGYISAYTGTFFVTSGMSLSFLGPEDWSNFEAQEY